MWGCYLRKRGLIREMNLFFVCKLSRSHMHTGATHTHTLFLSLARRGSRVRICRGEAGRADEAERVLLPSTWSPNVSG